MSATGRGGAREVLDRYYTPDALALACIWALPAPPSSPRAILEPSVGGGSFARAARKRWGYSPDLVCIDIDPEAPGLRQATGAVVGDFAAWRPSALMAFDLVVGNPPYAHAEGHIRHAFAIVAPGGRVGFLLRLAFLESLTRRQFWKMHPPESVSVVTPRPSFTGGGTDASAYAWFVWRKERGVRVEPRLGWLDWTPELASSRSSLPVAPEPSPPAGSPPAGPVCDGEHSPY